MPIILMMEERNQPNCASLREIRWLLLFAKLHIRQQLLIKNTTIYIRSVILFFIHDKLTLVRLYRIIFTRTENNQGKKTYVTVSVKYIHVSLWLPLTHFVFVLVCLYSHIRSIHVFRKKIISFPSWNKAIIKVLTFHPFLYISLKLALNVTRFKDIHH